VVVAGAAALGFLILQAAARYGEVSVEFDQQAAELRRLSELPLYPNAENEKRLVQQQKEYSTAIEELLAKLQSQQPVVEETSPDAFKTRLVRERDAFAEKAKAARVKIPENFFLGFDDYETNLPPDAQTATLLLRQLMAVNSVLGKLVEAGVAEINGVRRKAVPGEKPADAPPGQEQSGKPGGDPPLISRYPFEVSFVGNQTQLRTVLNGLAELPHFLILRALNVENSKKEGPSRAGAENTGATAMAVDGSRRSLILGTEAVVMTALLELVVFQTGEGGK
jgi:hypothetical protein